MKQILKGLLLPIRGLGKALSKAARCCVRLMRGQSEENVMDGAAYEVFVAKCLRDRGFRQVLHTGATGDFGVDIVAKKHGVYYAIQCKYYSGAVSGAAVQEAVAGMAYYHCDRAMVVTNSSLTRGAKALAEANQVLVLEHLEPGKVTAAEIATPERIISVAIGVVLFVLLLPQIRTEKATAIGVYILVLILCYLVPRSILALLKWLWRRGTKKL